MEGKRNVSFTLLEKEFIHTMRSGINNSEDKADLEKNFANVMKLFMKRVFEINKLSIDIDDNDFMFNPKARNYFTVSGRLRQMQDFKNLWEGTEIASVIARFADSTHKKYLHLDRQREKARFKIRNVV